MLDWQIKKIALTFFSTPDNAWKILTSDIETDVGMNFVSFPITGSATNTEERKLELFTEWRIGDLNGNGITNEEEGSDWWVGKRDSYGMDVDLLCGYTPGTICPKFRENPGTVEQYSTLFEYWESEVYIRPQLLAGLDADYILMNFAAPVSYPHLTLPTKA